MSVNTEIDDGLTEEERAALAEDEGSAGATAEDDVAATAKAIEDAKVAEEAEKSAEESAKSAEIEKTGEEHKDPETPETPEVPESPTQSAPILVAQPVADIQVKLDEISTKKSDLLSQFDEGELTAKEFQIQLDSLNKQERTLEREQDHAELAAKMDQQRLQNDWNAQCNSFVERHAIYKENPRLYKALDAEVRELATKPESANWTGQKFLEEAHKNLKEAFKFEDASSAKKIERPARPDLPPNLAKVPAADIEDTSGNRFAVLDRLAETDLVRYQETLDTMSDSERNAYMARG